MKNNKKIIAYIAGAVVIIALIVGSAYLINMRNNIDLEPVEDNTASDVPEVKDEVPEVAEPELPTADKIAGPPEPVMLDWMADLYAQNPDIVGWIRIDGTKLDYPVMFTPDDEEKYIYKNFDGRYDLAGLPFIDKDCSLDPESDNLVIYGHNMNNGTAFKAIMSYTSQKFWKEHPIVYFSTLYEERTYEVVATFYDRVYKKTDDCFKFYQFIDYETEEQFNEAVTYFLEKSTVDTGVVPEYGDNFIMLVTCSYHVDYGRFVLVAREITEEPAETGTVGE